MSEALPMMAADVGVEEARGVLSAIIKSLWAFIQQIAVWVQSLATRVFEFMASNPLAMIMLLTDIGILLA